MPTWMNRSPEREAARQAAHRARRQEKGLCIRCGDRQAPASRQLCLRHLLAQREQARQRLRAKPRT